MKSRYSGLAMPPLLLAGLFLVQLAAVAQLPNATTLAATNFTPGGAQLNGQVNPSGSAAMAWFEWGATTAYGNATVPQPVGAGISPVSVSNAIDGLALGSSYSFRLMASNEFGVVSGGNRTFTQPGFVRTTIPGLPGVYYSSMVWGDYDNDGRLDFLLTGRTNSGASELISQLWRNTESGFSNVTASVAPGLPGVERSSLAWGDYDNDGRLDFLLTGRTNSGASDVISQLWRNTGSGFRNVTASVAPGLPAVANSSVAWGDYDNDARLDFLLTGRGAGSVSQLSQLWRNTATGFSNVTATVAPGLPGLEGGSVAWGDYDADGRLDFMIMGSHNNGDVSGLWRNTGAGFSNVTVSVVPGLLGVGSVAWGDYDNDGRLDFLLMGFWETFGISRLWRNTGSSFSDVTSTVVPGLPGVYLPGGYGSSVAWGDYDNDGRLDFLLMGSGLWRNIMPVASNAPPAAPTGLSATPSGIVVDFHWDAPPNDLTPAPGLNYNLRIGSTPGASDVLAPMAFANGLRLLPVLGNAQTGTNASFILPPGLYYWSVQALDTSFAGSAFAIEQQFSTVPLLINPVRYPDGLFEFHFTNQTAWTFDVLVSTNIALPLSSWLNLGPALNLGGGLYRFTDPGAIGQARRFYILQGSDFALGLPSVRW